MGLCANPNLGGLNGRAALHEAARKGQVAIAEQLFAAGANVDGQGEAARCYEEVLPMIVPRGRSSPR
jgi:ankyrin repeat protein